MNTKGPKQESHNRPRSHMPEGGELEMSVINHVSVIFQLYRCMNKFYKFIFVPRRQRNTVAMITSKEWEICQVLDAAKST